MKKYFLASMISAIVLVLVACTPATKTDQSNGTSPTDGKLDLSGIWEMKLDRPCPPEGCPDGQIGYQFIDIGFGLPGGLPFQPWAQDLVKQRMSQNGKDDPGSHCQPVGIVKLHTTPFRRKIIQTPGLLVILYERDAMYRQIFTDGRPLPTEVEPPSINGFSTGQWEGDTLVVQTIGFKQGETDKDGPWLDRNGSPLTSAARITEKFRRLNHGNLEVTLTVDDPKAYTAPWTIKLNQVLAPDGDLLDYLCSENEKDASRLADK